MTKQTNRTVSRLALAFFVVGCASAPPAEQETGEPTPTSRPTTATLPPVGYGTLKQDAFTVAFASGDVQIKLTPLDESVIRLAAPDTYQRLHRLVDSRTDRIREASRNAGLRHDPLVFLVSFFTYAQQAEFNPTDLQLLSQGILYRPVGILPLTPEWGRQQLKQEKSESALYLFDPHIDLQVAFQVEYGRGGDRALGWGSIIRVLEAERARVLSRAGS